MRGRVALGSSVISVMRMAFAAMLLSLGAMAPGDGARAQTIPPAGASGEHQSPDHCLGPTYLVGFVVRSGDWLNQIAIICSPVDANGRTGVPWGGPLRGGNLGSPFPNAACAPNAVAVGLLIHLTSDGRRVRGIGIDCKDAHDVQRQGLGRIVDLGHNDTPAISQLCNPGNAIVEVNINYGADVNGVGVTCAKVAAAPPPSSQTAAAAAVMSSAEQRFAKLSTAFQGWLRTNGIVNATLSNGVYSVGYGTRKADDVFPVASLSKAITASCIASLVDAGKLSYTDKVSTRLSSVFELWKTFDRTWKIADARANDITIEHLLRHTSGFPGEKTLQDTGKELDVVVPPWPAGVANTAAADEAFARAQLARNLTGAPGTVASDYNNVNYALLGIIIKQVTGQSYEAYCKQAVLNPHPFSDVRIGAGTPALGAFGGWEMSAKQYADFISTHYRKLSSTAEPFMQNSYAVGYGLGVGVKKTPKGRNIWHFGNWPGVHPVPALTNPAQFSSYFALWDSGDLVVVLIGEQLDVAHQQSLDKAFTNALGE
jgi:CubicO group peptidase (beta-lactamase class C family)